MSVYGDLSDGYGYRRLYRFRLTPDGYTILREIDLGAAIAILCPTNTPNPWASLSVRVAYHFTFQPRPPPHNNIAQSPNLSPAHDPPSSAWRWWWVLGANVGRRGFLFGTNPPWDAYLPLQGD